MGNIESKVFESCIRIRHTSEGYEVVVKIESTLTNKPVWVEKKQMFYDFPTSFEDIVRETEAEFIGQFDSYEQQ